MIKYMAVAVALAVAVCGAVAVPVARLTNSFKSQPKRFLNQCLGLRTFSNKKHPTPHAPFLLPEPVTNY